MSVVYIREQGASVRKAGERVTIEKGGKVIADLPVFEVTDLSVFGNVQITTPVLHLLMENGVDTAFFSYSGKYLGHIGSESSKNIFLRFAQYELYQNQEKRLEMARRIVKNKTENQICLLNDNFQKFYTSNF